MTACPYCGGRRVRPITPSELECVTPLPAALAPPGADLFASVRPCGHLFRVATDVRTPPCSCGRESLAECVDCRARLCGLHGAGGSEVLCEACRQKRLLEKQLGEEETIRDHEQGLVDIGESLGPGGFSGKVHLQNLWDAVFDALEDEEPTSDIMILDSRRLDELPSRWPRTQGLLSGRSRAKWEDAVDRLAVPSWNTGRKLKVGGGIADTYSISSYPLYVGRNGVVYCAPEQPTPNGTHAGWSSSPRSASAVPGAWTAQWSPRGTYYPRQEIAEALANLAAIHALSPSV